MKTIFCKFLLFVITTIVSSTIMAQSEKNAAVAFKEIHRKQATDNFTAREIKKKELKIAPSEILLINLTDKQAKEVKYRKKKKVNL